MLRLVGRQPGISVREAATELGLVPNTASTLVSKLTADGLAAVDLQAEVVDRGELAVAVRQV